MNTILVAWADDDHKPPAEEIERAESEYYSSPEAALQAGERLRHRWPIRSIAVYDEWGDMVL